MDLLSTRPFWPLRDGLPRVFPPLDEHARCDVAIIGGGIGGALMAWSLATAGLHVVLLDRREVAHGSTAGNTGLVIFETDEMLHRLSARMGDLAAVRVYRRCRRALISLAALVRAERMACEFVPRQTLFLAATPAHVPRLRREFEARRAAGLEVEWWTRRDLARESSLPHAAGILSSPAAEIDPYRFTYATLCAARRAGARIHDRTTVTRRITRRNGVDLFTDRGPRVRAQHLVLATGYEAEKSLTRRVGALHSTFALASEPLGGNAFAGWPADRCLIWDTGNPYLYLRTTADNRAIVGGYDVPFAGARARDRLLPAKTRALKRRFNQFFPHLQLEVATAWAGTFGVSADALPVIGQHPTEPRTWLALGFGGNGITFSLIAAEIIRAAILGDEDSDAMLFGFERL